MNEFLFALGIFGAGAAFAAGGILYLVWRHGRWIQRNY